MNKLYEQGVECLNSDGENCAELFRRSINASNQVKDDTSALILIQDIVNAYISKGGDLSERAEFSQTGIDLAKEKNNAEFNWRFHVCLAEALGYDGKYEKQLNVIERSIIIAKDENDPIWLARSFGIKAQYYMNTAQYPEAVKTAIKAKQYAEKTEKDDVIVLAQMILSSSYYFNEDYQLASNYLEKSRKLYLKLGDTLNAMYVVTNWCNIQGELRNTKLVIERLPAAIDYFRRHKLHSRAVFPMAQLGKAYNYDGQYQRAADIVEEAYQQCIDLKMDQHAAYCAILLSESHYFLKNPKACLEYSTIAYNYHKDRQASQEYLTAFRKQARALMLNEQYKEASEILVEYIECKDSIFNKEKMEEIAFLQEKFETKAKNDKILLLRKEKETIKNRNIALIIGLILTTIIAWLLIKRKSIKMKLKQAENDKMNAQIKNKNKELTSQALHLAQKNELLISLKNDLASISNDNAEADIKSLEQKLKFDEQIDQNWEQFTKFFSETKSDFFKNLTEKHPAVGKSDLRMSALISMSLDSKEIASILNISSDGVKKARYRLRKKLGLESKDELSNYLTQF